MSDCLRINLTKQKQSHVNLQDIIISFSIAGFHIQYVYCLSWGLSLYSGFWICTPSQYLHFILFIKPFKSKFFKKVKKSSSLVSSLQYIRLLNSRIKFQTSFRNIYLFNDEVCVACCHRVGPCVLEEGLPLEDAKRWLDKYHISILNPLFRGSINKCQKV